MRPITLEAHDRNNSQVHSTSPAGLMSPIKAIEAVNRTGVPESYESVSLTAIGDLGRRDRGHLLSLVFV